MKKLLVVRNDKLGDLILTLPALKIIKSIETKKLDLEFQINSAWKKIESSKSSIDSLEISVESNLMAVEGVTKEASVGTRTTLEILDA